MTAFRRIKEVRAVIDRAYSGGPAMVRTFSACAAGEASGAIGPYPSGPGRPEP
jgi:hypothetical protein